MRMINKQADYHKQYKKRNAEKIAAQKKVYRKKNVVKITVQKKVYYTKNAEKIAAQKKLYHQENKDKIAIRRKKYYQDHKDEISLKGKIYYQKNCNKIQKRHRKYIEENKEKISLYRVEYVKKNKTRIQQYTQDYYKKNKEKITKKNVTNVIKRYCSDINYRLKHILRSRLCSAVRNKQKTGSAVRDLGCTIEEFKIYIENKFTEGMSWENYGKWHLDHIKPLSKFDLTDREQFLQACHYKNMQPLWGIDNLRKGNKC